MRQISKKILSFFLSKDIAIWFYLKLKKKRLRIILYHGISDSTDELRSSQVIRSIVFEKQLAYLKNHYNIVPLINAISGGNAIGNDLTITFDDGYENVLEIASPLLLKYGMTASVYVNPKLIDQTEAGEYKPAWWDIIDNLFNETTAGQFTEVFEKFDIGFRREKSLAKIKIAMEETLKELPAAISARIAEELQCRFSSQMKEKAFPRLMTWGQLQQLSNKGFEIGAHTMSHLSVASLPEEKYEYELVECKKTIESRLGIKVESFAFPYGGDKHFNFNSLKVLKDAGYLCALLVSGSADDQFCLSRISIHKNDDFQMFKIKVAGIYEDFASIYRKINNIWKRN